MITKRNNLLSKKVIQGLKNRHMNGYYVHSKQEALDLAFEIYETRYKCRLGAQIL